MFAIDVETTFVAVQEYLKTEVFDCNEGSFRKCKIGKLQKANSSPKLIPGESDFFWVQTIKISENEFLFEYDSFTLQVMEKP